MSLEHRRLIETFDAVTAISRRLSSSITGDAQYFPVTPERAAAGDADAEKAFDAFLQRFNQMLDHMLRKLFPRLQAVISADDELLPVLQLIETLHRANVIDDVGAWKELIEVRNRLTHEYALDPAERATALNDAWTRAPLLLAQLQRARSYAERHGLLKGEDQ